MSTMNDLRLGTYGVWTGGFETAPAALIRDYAQELDERGWSALWIPEHGGREALTHAGFLLSVTEHLTVINGIALIGLREPQGTRGAALLLADAYPNRHVLGLGVGIGTPDSKPLREMNEFLDGLGALDAAENINPAPSAPMRRLLAAYGPQMLALARDRSNGAHTYHVPVEHTAQAREILGTGAFLGVEQPVLFETDETKAREIARAHVGPFLTAGYNLAKFRRLGYTEADIDSVSDRIVDDLVFWGDLEMITTKLGRHVEAGADHVAVQVIGVESNDAAMGRWRELAEALL